MEPGVLHKVFTRAGSLFGQPRRANSRQDDFHSAAEQNGVIIILLRKKHVSLSLNYHRNKRGNDVAYLL